MAIIISKTELNKFKQKTSFVEFIHRSPLSDVKIDLTRNKTLTRNIEYYQQNFITTFFVSSLGS